MLSFLTGIQIQPADYVTGQIRINVQYSKENQAHRRKLNVCLAGIFF